MVLPPLPIKLFQSRGWRKLSEILSVGWRLPPLHYVRSAIFEFADALTNSFRHPADLAVKTRGGHVLVSSDEWFAESHNLLTAAAPISRKGHFTANGAWFDGWETRRHGSGFDW